MDFEIENEIHTDVLVTSNKHEIHLLRYFRSWIQQFLIVETCTSSQVNLVNITTTLIVIF